MTLRPRLAAGLPFRFGGLPICMHNNSNFAGGFQEADETRPPPKWGIKAGWILNGAINPPQIFPAGELNSKPVRFRRA